VLGSLPFCSCPRRAWASSSLATAAAPERGEPEAGEEVFASNCAMCHGHDGSGMMGMHPSLRGADERLSLQGVEVTVRNGRATTPPMPAFGGRLSDAEIDDVVAYVASLPEGPRNFGPGRSDGMMDRHAMMGEPAADGSALVWTALVVILVVLAVAALFWVLWPRRAVIAASRRGGSGSPARDELDRRYAAGELPRDEYLQRRRDIES
jgi:cytochrome c6